MLCGGDSRQWGADERAGGLPSLLVQLVPTSVSVFDGGCGGLQKTNGFATHSSSVLGNLRAPGPPGEPQLGAQELNLDMSSIYPRQPLARK